MARIGYQFVPKDLKSLAAAQTVQIARPAAVSKIAESKAGETALASLSRGDSRASLEDHAKGLAAVLAAAPGEDEAAVADEALPAPKHSWSRRSDP